MSSADSTAGQPAPRVVIADDQTLVRTGFRMILRDAGIPVVAEAADENTELPEPLLARTS